MADNEGREQLSKGIDQLSEENRLYVLDIEQGLVFAQKTINMSENIATEKGVKK